MEHTESSTESDEKVSTIRAEQRMVDSAGTALKAVGAAEGYDSANESPLSDSDEKYADGIFPDKYALTPKLLRYLARLDPAQLEGNENLKEWIPPHARIEKSWMEKDHNGKFMEIINKWNVKGGA